MITSVGEALGRKPVSFMLTWLTKRNLNEHTWLSARLMSPRSPVTFGNALALLPLRNQLFGTYSVRFET